MNLQFQLDNSETLFLFIDALVPELLKQLYQINGVIDQEALYIFPPFDKLVSTSPIIILATPQVQEWFWTLDDNERGYFFSSTNSLEQVANQLRSLILVNTPVGEGLLHFSNNYTAQILLETNCAELWAAIRKVWIYTYEKWHFLENPLVIPPPSPKENTLPRITDQQWEKLKLIPWNTTLPKRIIQHMTLWFPEYCQTISDIKYWIKSHVDIAYEKGFHTEKDLLYYFNILGYDKA